MIQVTIMEWLRQMGTPEFWQTLLNQYEDLGPLASMLLAMVESFFPPLPLIMIVALNVAAHGGLMGFVYSWVGVALGGGVVFLFWRHVVKRFFWRYASRFSALQKAERWVSRFDTAALFMVALLPFTPTSFLHLAFGISDFDARRYLLILLGAKGIMVGSMALFGQSVVSSLRNPLYLLLAIGIWCAMYVISKWFCKKHHLN